MTADLLKWPIARRDWKESSSYSNTGTTLLPANHASLKPTSTRRYGEEVPEELRDWSNIVLLSTITGFLAGGLFGARVGADKFIASKQFAKFPSQMQAQVRSYAVLM